MARKHKFWPHLAWIIGIPALVISIIFLTPIGDTPPAPPSAPADLLQTRVDSFDGQHWHLSHFAGKPIVVNFWATWCAPCVKELPILAKLARQYSNDAVFIGLTIDSPVHDIMEMVQKFKLPYPIAKSDFQTLSQWGSQSLPATFVFDAKGALILKHIGVINEDMIRKLITVK